MANLLRRSVTSFNFELLDYTNDGKVEGVQTEVQHLLDQLAVMLPPAGKPKSSLAVDATWTRFRLKAAHNWRFVAYGRLSGSTIWPIGRPAQGFDR